jgi:hypothetical protein
MLDRYCVDIHQAIAMVNSGILPRAPRFHVQRFHAALPVYPDDAVFRKPEPVLLLKVDKRSHAGGKRKYGEDCGG